MVEYFSEGYDFEHYIQNFVDYLYAIVLETDVFL